MVEFDERLPRVRACAPGRTELAGNHTDHQGGRVIAATLDCGVEIVAQARTDGWAHLESEGFAPVEIDLSDTAPRAGERSTTAGLVRGVVAGLREAGVAVNGFAAKASSSIPGGSGLSSSAAFELALAAALVRLAKGRDAVPESPVSAPGPSAVQLARIAQAAEREWFGKPCGLMDQLSIALGGVNEMDFGGEDVRFEPIPFDFEQAGWALFLVDAHCDHSLYTDEYAQVALDMDAVARFFGRDKLSSVDETEFFASFAEVRCELGDLPALRGLHYYHEMALVDARADALRSGDMAAFLEATRRSGASSAQYLQNVSTADHRTQPAMVALALADNLAGAQGAVRIHGGGFGGTIQAFVPEGRAGEFARAMDARLGEGSCKRYRITMEGASATWVS